MPQKSPTTKAINYTLRHWDRLTRFCKDGRYLIDNNHTEKEIKPFVIARKTSYLQKAKKAQERHASTLA